jgi:hypothetical protein
MILQYGCIASVTVVIEAKGGPLSMWKLSVKLAELQVEVKLESLG